MALNTISYKPAIGSLGNFFSEKSWLKLVEKSSLKFDFFFLQKMYLVMELCEGGELFDVLRERQTFCEKDTKVIMTKMAKATSYLHKRGMYL